MTEQQIRELAKTHGLEVLKRIQTGNNVTHFADFELSGDREKVLNAAMETRYAEQPRPALACVTNPDHPDKGKAYLLVESVWCDMRELTAEQKSALYRAGKYSFPPPPVLIANWDEAAWIKFIDREGRWHNT